MSKKISMAFLPQDSCRCYRSPARIRRRRIIMVALDMRHDARQHARKSSRTGAKFTMTKPSYDETAKNIIATGTLCVGPTSAAQAPEKSPACATK